MWSGSDDGWQAAPAVVAPFGMRPVGKLLRWCWSYRELVGVYLVAPQLVAGGLLGSRVVGVSHLLGLGFGLATTALGLCLFPFWRRWLMRWLILAQRRHYLHRIRRDWPEICRMLGWSRAYGKDGLGTSRILVAALRGLRFERDGQALVLEVKPMADQPRKTWGVMTDQFRRYLGVAVARWEEPSPGVLRMVLSREPLPALIPFPRGLPPAAWDALRLGVRAGWDEVVWRPSDTPHLLVGGVTKGGKGGVLRSVAHDALLSGWVLCAVNPKLSGEFGWLERLGVPVVEALPEALEVVEAMERERLERQEIIKRAGVGAWDQVPGWQRPPLMLIVDEVSALLMVDKANKDVAKVQERLSYLITRLAQLGRSAGIHLLLATQRPDVSTLGPNGGLLRDNIDGRIGVCSLQEAGVSMLFGNGLDPDIKDGLDGTKGRALATMLSAGDFDVYPLQLYWLDERELVRQPPCPLVPQLRLSSDASKIFEDGEPVLIPDGVSP